MIIKIVQRVCFAIIVIYSIDVLIKNLNVFIPINHYTVVTVALLGFPGLVSLALSLFLLVK